MAANLAKYLTFFRPGGIFPVSYGGLTMLGRSSVVPLFVFFVAALLTACSSPSSQSVQTPDTRAADADAIRAADADWGKAMQAKDVDKSISFYADDAILFGNKAPAITGRENIRKEFQKMLNGMTGAITFTNTGVDVARSGELAWDHGTWEFTSTDKNGKPVTERGKYLTVWKKQADGIWKAVGDIDNDDQ